MDRNCIAGCRAFDRICGCCSCRATTGTDCADCRRHRFCRSLFCRGRWWSASTASSATRMCARCSTTKREPPHKRLLLFQHDGHLLVFVTELAFELGALLVEGPLERGVSDLQAELDFVAGLFHVVDRHA